MTVANLGFAIDSNPITRAAVDLDKLSESAEKAEKSAGKLGSSTGKAFKDTGNGATELSRKLKKAADEVDSVSARVQKAFNVRNSIGNVGSSIGRELITGLASVINPATIATAAIATLTSAAVTYFSTLREKAATAEENLKAHADFIRQIEDRWPGATEGLKRYLQEGTESMRSAASERAAFFEDEAKKAAGAFRTQVELSGLITGGATQFFVADRFKPFEEALIRLQSEIDKGEPNFRAFYQNVERIVATDPSGLTKLGTETNKLARTFESADQQAKAARASISLIGGAAASQVEQVNQLSAAMRALAGIGLPTLDSRQLAQYNFEIATNRATDRAAKDDAYNAYQDAIKRIEDQERFANLPKPEDKPNRESIAPVKDAGVAKSARDAERAANAYRDLIKSVDDRIGQMELEAQLVGKTGVEADTLRLRLELLQSAEDKGRHASPEQVKEIESKVAAYQKLAEATAKATLKAELQFEREQMFRSDIDQTIASRLKDAGLPIDFDSVQAGLIRTNEQLKEARALAGDFASTFIQGIESGKSVFESLGDAALSVLDRITDKLLNDVLNALFEVNNAGSGGGGGGIFGSILGALGLGGGGSYGKGFFPSAPSMGEGGLYANGDAFPNGISGFSNSIVNSPTLFKFAKGTGMMGEAGPEAIMPLKRDSAGRLGVSAQTGSPANNNKPQEVTLRILNEEGPMFRTTIRAESEEVSVKVVQQNNENQKNYKQNGGE